MTDDQHVRRHSDGSIDFDFYRARATTMRRQAMRDAFARKVAGRSAAAIVASIPAGLI
jgi:hypothetical protein